MEDLNSTMEHNVSNVTSSLEEDHKVYGVIQASIDLCFIPFIVGGNLLVILAVYATPKLQTMTNLFIVSLAVADMLVGVLTIPLYALFYLEIESVMHNKYLCLIRYSSVIVSCGASLLNLTFIAIDRYVAIIYPLRYRAIITPLRVKVSIFLMWSYNTVMGLLPVMGWNKWTDEVHCVIFDVMSPIWIILSDFMLGAVCLLLTLVLYGRVFYVALGQHKQINSSSSHLSEQARLKQNRELKSAKVMAFVLLMFIIFWAPYFILAPMKYINGIPGKTMVVVKDFALCLSFSNSMLNPIIYGFLRKDFKEAFKKFLFIQVQKYSNHRQSQQQHNMASLKQNMSLKTFGYIQNLSSSNSSLPSLRSLVTTIEDIKM